MSKSAKMTIKLEISVPVEHQENDKGMGYRDLASIISGGILIEIRKTLEKNKRKPELVRSIADYSETFVVRD